MLDPKNSDFAGDEREDERGGFLDRYLHKRRVREKRDEEEEEEEERNRVSKEEFGLVDVGAVQFSFLCLNIDGVGQGE